MRETIHSDRRDDPGIARPPAPLLPVAIGLILGIALDDVVPLSIAAACLLLAAGIIIGVFARRWVMAASCGVIVAAVGLGALRHALADRWLASNPIAAYTQRQPILAHITGRVASEPTIFEPRPDVPRAYAIGPKTGFLLDAQQIAGVEAPIPVAGTVRVSIKEAMLDLRPGERVAMTGWLYKSGPPVNPGGYDWARHYRRRGILAGFSCDHAASVRVLEKRAASAGRASLDRLRARLRAYLTEGAFEEGDPAAGVLSAMVLGQRSRVNRAINEAFIRTGNAHFLATSGMHVGWLAFLGWGLLRLCGAGYRLTALLVAMLILSYVLLAEPRPAVMRAGIIGILGCWSFYHRGMPNVPNWLAAAALLILLIEPNDVFRLGFQFSFITVLSVMYVTPCVYGSFMHAIAKLTNNPHIRAASRPQGLGLGDPVERIPVAQTPATRVLRHFVRIPLGLLSVSIAAWLASAPLACYHFNKFTPWGWLGNTILWPPAMLVTMVGYLKVITGLILPSSGALFGPLLAVTADAMLTIVQFLAKMPAALVWGRSPSLPWLLAVYATLWLWAIPPRRIRLHGEKTKIRHGYKVLILLLLAWWAVPPRWSRHDPDALTVWMLAIGDGTATVIELPNGKTLIYDFGTRSPFDAGGVGAAFLQSRGIRRLDTVFVSHPNFDHYGAVESLAKQFDIGRIVINDQFEHFVEDTSAAGSFLKFVRESGLPLTVTRGRHSFDDLGDVTLEAIWPPPREDYPAPTANDSSTVLRLTYQGKTVLLTGDIAEWGLGGLLAGGDIAADVLALPHHGSIIHNTAAFIQAVRPAVAVRSTGQRASMTLHRIHELVGDRQYLSTADDGCVRITIRKSELSVRTMRQGL